MQAQEPRLLVGAAGAAGEDAHITEPAAKGLRPGGRPHAVDRRQEYDGAPVARLTGAFFGKEAHRVGSPPLWPGATVLHMPQEPSKHFVHLWHARAWPHC